MTSVTGRSGSGVLGIDIGGTKFALRAESAGTRVYERSLTWPMDSGAEADVAALAAEIEALRAESGLRITAVGVAMPATTDPTGRVTVWPGRPSWTGLQLDETLRRLFPDSRTAWADDGDLAALAEARHVGADNIVYLGVGTGVGGGVILDGRPLPGPGRGTPEIGHMVVALDGPWCDCGRQGCLQAIASGPATLRRARIARGSEVSFAELRDGLREDQPWAQETIRPSGRALAAAIVSLGELVDPAVAVLGGGFAAGLPGFVEFVEQEIARLARPGRAVPAVRAAALGGLSSLHGALALALSLSEVPATAAH